MTDKAQLAFGEHLRRLRERAGFSTGKQFAETLGWIASKVSRIENGRTLPADSDLLEWLAAVECPAEETETLRDELRELRLDKANWKRRLRTGHAEPQRYHQGIEQTASTITTVETAMVPGLVQTAEYARAVFQLAADLHNTPHDTEAAVRERIRRQDVLYHPDKTITILITESALLHPIASPAVMMAQIDRLATISELPNVHLGVIPIGAQLPTITLHGYMQIDDLVLVEVNHTEFEVTAPDDLAIYHKITDKLCEAAAKGDTARHLLKTVHSRLT